MLCLLGALFTCCNHGNRMNGHANVTIENSQFIDGQRRTIIWNGLNLVNKNPEQGYVDPNDEELFKQFSLWGVNCVRYGIHWDGLEPEPGKINEAYLAEIDKRVHWASKNGISLILDMHQDLYSRKFGNGAPLWATLDEDLPHVTGQVWSDAYLMSPAVQKAFDNFWLNAQAADGIGIQDHYINVWKVLAERYNDSTSVVGFDVMNEPFMGTKAQLVLGKLVEGCASCLASTRQANLSEEQFFNSWTDTQKRNELLAILDNKEVFLKILGHASEYVQAFEENELSLFYQKIRNVVRNSGSQKILFFEHNYFCNMGIESTFKVPVDKNQQPDTLCAYAPHAYDLVVDTDGATSPGYKRLDTIFEQLSIASNHRNLPIIIGEWGAFYMGRNYLEPAKHHIKWISQLKAGHTYWSWWPDIETQDYFSTVISRPYPQYINGQLISYLLDTDTHVFHCKWEESQDHGLSRFYLPDVTKITTEKLKLVPKTTYTLQRISNESTAGYLDVESCGEIRELQIYFDN